MSPPGTIIYKIVIIIILENKVAFLLVWCAYKLLIVSPSDYGSLEWGIGSSVKNYHLTNCRDCDHSLIVIHTVYKFWEDTHLWTLRLFISSERTHWPVASNRCMKTHKTCCGAVSRHHRAVLVCLRRCEAVLGRCKKSKDVVRQSWDVVKLSWGLIHRLIPQTRDSGGYQYTRTYETNVMVLSALG